MQLKPWTLAEDLKRDLRPAYLINSDEPLQREEACDAIVSAARAVGYDERSVLYMDSDEDWDLLQQDAAAMSLFSSRKVLDVRVKGNKFGKVGAAALRDYVANPPADTLLLIRSDRLDGNQRKSSWVKAIDGIGAVLTVYDMDPGEVPRWLKGRLRPAGLTLQDDALRYLAERIEGNLLAGRQHVEKLALQDFEQPIALSDVMACIEDASSYGVFDLANAVLAGESARVTRAIASLQEEGLSIFAVLPAVGASFRNVLAGRTFGPLKDLAASFRRRHRLDALRDALTQFALIDAQGKGQLLGNEWEFFERLMLNLAGDGQQPLPTIEDFRPLLTRR